jgi:hypothetical protein
MRRTKGVLKMAWYYGTYSCGHDGREDIVGPTKNRQWIADRKFEGLCYECYQAKLEADREAANREALEKAREMELPELTGTEKQVAWANTLRQQVIERFEAKIKEGFTPSVTKRHGITEEKLRATLQNILSTKTDAKWYIDNRDIGSYQIIECMKQYEAERVLNRIQDEPETQEPKKLETKTVMPENCEHKEPAIIKLHKNKDTIKVKFPRNDKFREIVKNLGFTWGSCWVKEITKYNGPARDRAVELGNKLLNAGFPINMDAGLIDDAVSGNYKPEQKRWIKAFTSGEHEGKLSISWVGYDDDLYRVAKKLPSAKWTGKSLAVKVNYWQEVEDFASLYGFSFSDVAKELIEKYKLQDVAVVTPTAQQEEKAVDGLKKILSSSDEVLDDLREER